VTSSLALRESRRAVMRHGSYEEVWKAAMGLRDTSDMSPIEAKWTGKEKHNNRKGTGMSFVMLIVIDGMML
jgi:hypothetical protein